MKHIDGRFTGSRERTVYFQCWEPESASRGVLLVVHGAGEHSGRYQSLAQYFTVHGYAVAALDHNGHGHSDGSYGHTESFSDYLEDLRTFQGQVAARYPGAPLFLLGHSMGGLISANYLLEHQDDFAGCILSGASITTEREPGPVQMWLIRLLAVTLPRLGLLQLDANGVSRDPAVVRDYVEDPLVNHGKMSARMLRELFAGMHAIGEGAVGITLPLLILHGSGDVMTSPEGSRLLHRNISSTDKTLKIYPGLYHEIFNEPERAEVLSDVLSWCEERLAAP